MSRERQFQWADPHNLVRGADGKTGLAFLVSILKGELPGAPISVALGFKLVHAEEGLARFEGWPDEYQYNPMGSVHGGWVATLLDSAMGSAVMSTLDTASAFGGEASAWAQITPRSLVRRSSTTWRLSIPS